jgi:hypothetical protein
MITQRIQQNAAAYGRVLIDPTLRQAEGAAILTQTVTREANIQAYNDTFLLIAAIAAGTILWAGVHIIRIRRETLAQIAAQQQAAQAAGAQNG